MSFKTHDGHQLSRPRQALVTDLERTRKHFFTSRLGELSTELPPHTKDATAYKRILARRKVSKCTWRAEPITSETTHCLCFANILAKARAVNQASLMVLRRSQPIDDDSKVMHVAPVTSSHTWRRHFGPPLLQLSLSLSLKRLSVPFVGAVWTSSLFLHTR